MGPDWLAPPRLNPPVLATGVGSKPKEALPDVWRAALLRRPQARRNSVIHSDQVLGDLVEPDGQMAGDVLAKHESWPGLSHEASNRGPEVARVIHSAALASRAERLAGVSRNDEIHRSTPRVAIDGGNVTPDRRRVQVAFFHTRDQ